jgi:hypothetical protein
MLPGAVNALAEIIGMVGGATLAVQTVVLGASLFQDTAFGEGKSAGPPQGAGSPYKGAQPYSQQPNVRMLVPSVAGARPLLVWI